jgi:hypothetical protein
VQVRAITEAAMNGEIDFKKALKNVWLCSEGFAKRYCKQLLKIYLLPKASLDESLEILCYKTAILWRFYFFLENTCKKNWESIMYMLMNLRLSTEN